MRDVKADADAAAERPRATGSRRYNSPRRRAQAADTRRRVLEAARRRFAELGLATTIADIAREAHSSPQTIYATFGSKGGVLIALLDELTAAAGIHELRDQLAEAAGDPRRQLALYVQFDRRLFEQASDVVLLGLASRGADPEVGAWFAEGERRRRANQAPLIRAWHAAGALREGLSESRAADILWALSGPAVYDLFVTQSAWSPASFERWLIELLEHALFSAPAS
jgi:AcrR family transcriptional regulator